MKDQLTSSGRRDSCGLEESKSPTPFSTSTSIAGARLRMADGGSGSMLYAPIIVETSVPPTYVASRVKAHDNGG